jgi:plastocyanin
MLRARLSIVAGAAILLGLMPLQSAAAEQMGPGAGTGPLMGPAAAFATGLAGPLRGCEWGRNQTVPGPAIAQLPRVTVNLYDGMYVPMELSIRPGTIVIWANRGTAPHSSTSWGNWDSGVLRPGDSCATWFVTPGVYPFLSIVAADGGMMLGALTVEGPPIGDGMAAAAGSTPGGSMAPGSSTPASGAGTGMGTGAGTSTGAGAGAGAGAGGGTGTGAAPGTRQ